MQVELDTSQIEKLVTQTQNGESSALTALVHLYQRPAQRVAQTILNDHQEGEDAVQEAWILAIRALPSLRQPERFGPWFYRIVANVALRRRQRRGREAQIEVAVDGLLGQRRMREEGSEEAREGWKDADALLPLAIEALSNRDRAVVNLHYFCQTPLEEIARLLEIPTGTVKSRLYHARQVLRKEILQMTAKQSVPSHTPNDFRQRIAGMKGEIHWQKIFSGNFVGWSEDRKPLATGALPINWQTVGSDGIVGENFGEGSRLVYGEPTWQELELSLLITPLKGGNGQIFFRVDEQHNRFYVVDLYLGWQAIGIRRVEMDAQGNFSNGKLSVVNYPLEHGREYALTLATIGHSITTYVDGALVNQVSDGSWLHGAIGLSVWNAKTLFRDIRVRFLG